ncbi:protein ENHANCED PSEUDOMONAS SUSCEPTIBILITY 1-like [Henckelia pumila]|uniref:protein ENHANCED PSEUDOMONAS SUSCEPTIBILITY 1-like n=1 Tax=Henckelia pumila TaxID=405737 RepID=UPI003C6E29C2
MHRSSTAAVLKMELAPWDLYCLSICYIQEGLVFCNPRISDEEFKKTLVNHLKTSLSRTLDFFPPLAGRLGATESDDGTSSFFVDCNNAGAEFTQAIAPGVSVSDILDPIYVPENIVSSFFPMNKICNVEGVSKPLLGVQVTELEDGFFVGCSANHVVVDGYSFWHFLNSWSEISRGSETISKVPVFQRWIPESIKLPIRFPTPFERRNMFGDFDSAPLLQRVFHFSKQNIAKLKSRANSEAGTEKISSLQSLLAHVWRSLLRGRRSSSTNRNPENQEIYFYMPIGTRDRIPLQNSYFGNAIYAAKVAATEDDILHRGLGYTAMKLHGVVAQQTMEQPIKTMEHWAANPTMPPSVGRNSNVCIVSSSPRFDVYGNNFGWGKPIAARSGVGSKFDGRIKVHAAADSDGINVTAYSTKESLEAMANDAEFMEAVTF